MHMINCPVCQGEAGKMGTLGNLTHYQCRACGMMFSRLAEFHWDDDTTEAVAHAIGLID